MRTSVSMEEVKNQALSLYGQELNVIPIVFKTKMPPKNFPLKTYFKKRATAEELDNWFNLSSKFNYAVVTGETSKNLAVVDFDDPAKYNEIYKKESELFDTFTVSTSRKAGNQRGRHCYFYLTEPIKSLIDSKKTRGFDIKCEGGFVIGPLSVHPSGDIYEVEKDVSIKYTTPGALFSALGIVVSTDNQEVVNFETQTFILKIDDGNYISYSSNSFYSLTRSNFGYATNKIGFSPLIINKIKKSGDNLFFSIVHDGKLFETPSLTELVKRIDILRTFSNRERGKIAAFFSRFRDFSLEGGLIDEMGEWISVNDVIKINYPINFDIPSTLNWLNELYAIITNPNAFSIILSYGVLMPFSYNFRKKGVRFPILLFDGKTKSGKSSMQTLIAETGFDQKQAKKTIRDFRTPYAMEHNLSDSVLPIVIDELSMQWIEKNEDYLKSAVSGSGSSSRGRITMDVDITDATRSLMANTNEFQELPEALSDRFLEVGFKLEHELKTDMRKFYGITDHIPNGFMYMFLKTLEDTNIDTLVQKIENIKSVDELKAKYLEIGYDIVLNTFKAYNIECKIKPPALNEEVLKEWPEIFEIYVLNVWYHLQLQKSYDSDGKRYNLPFFVQKQVNNIEKLEGEKYKINTAFYKLFVNDYRDCPYKSLTGYAEEFGLPTPENKRVNGRVCKSVVIDLSNRVAKGGLEVNLDERS